MKELSIGIDFGTYKTLVSHVNPQTGHAETLRLGRGNDYLPTTIFVDKDGNVNFADEADDLLEGTDGCYLRGFKMNLGSPTPLHVYLKGGQPRMLTAKELVKDYLHYIRTQVEELVYHGQPITTATITRPVKFSPAQCEELRQAALEAGFNSVTFTTEPEAAGLAFCRLNAAQAFKRSALIVDWGGGTLDFALVTRSKDSISTHSNLTDGETTGGENFDEKLWTLAEQTVKNQGVTRLNPITQLPRVRRAKEQLSSREQVTLRLSYEGGTCPPLPLTRTNFNNLIAEDINRAAEKVKGLLARIPTEHKPEMLLLVGGSSRIPLIKEKLEAACELPAYSWHYSREAVAIGAALWGSAPPVYSVELIHAGASPFGVVRALPGLIPGIDMMQAMEMVEKLPCTLSSDLNEADAEKLCNELRRMGAEVRLISANSKPEEEAPAKTAEPTHAEEQIPSSAAEELIRVIRSKHNLPHSEASVQTTAAPSRQQIQTEADSRVESIAEPIFPSMQYRQMVEREMNNLSNKLLQRTPLKFKKDNKDSAYILNRMDEHVNGMVNTCYKSALTLSNELSSLLISCGYSDESPICNALKPKKETIHELCTLFQTTALETGRRYISSDRWTSMTKGEIIGGVTGGILGVLTVGIAAPFTAAAGAKIGKAIDKNGYFKSKTTINIDGINNELHRNLNQVIPYVINSLSDFFLNVTNTTISSDKQVSPNEPEQQVAEANRLTDDDIERNVASDHETREYLQELVNTLVDDPFRDLSDVPHQYILEAANQVLKNNLQVTDYSSAILNAAEKDDLKTLRLLVLAEANVNATTFTGKTPLHLAAEKGNLQCVQIITQHKDININAEGRFSVSSPLCLAAENGHTEIVKYLLSLPGIKSNLASPLEKACANAHVECAKCLLAFPKVDVNFRSPILSALQHSPECTQLLLARPETDVCKLYAGSTALHFAAANNMKEELWQMLNRPNIRLDIKNSDGDTPLHLAASNGHADCLYYILKAPCGAPDVNTCNKEGMTALHLAARMGYHECVATLLHTCPNIIINCRNKDGKTPLDLTQGFSIKRTLFSKSDRSNIQECEKLLKSYARDK